MNKVKVEVLRLTNGEGLPLPKYATLDSAGVDLLAAVDEKLIIEAGRRCLVRTGIAISLPTGFEAQIRPRSGLALKNGITILNSPGTIDADYRGEIGVILINFGDEKFVVNRGMRVAQLVIASVTQVSWKEVVKLPTSERGGGGFGSTGQD